MKGDVFPTRVMKAYRRNGGTDPLILNLVGGEVHAPAALLWKELPVPFLWKSRENLIILECRKSFEAAGI